MKKRLLLTGSSGFVGKAISDYFQSQGYEVTTVSRSSNASNSLFLNFIDMPEDLAPFEHFDVCIHLAGESVAEGRWTKGKKERIYHSRVNSTRFLADLFIRLSHPPKVFLCASAIGYYGDQKREIESEDSLPGESFLSYVCKEWEKSAQKAKESGVRVLSMRFGVVLGKGGVLAKMRLPFLLGMGGVMGTGEQFISWVHIQDLVRAALFLVQHQAIEGPVNFSTPHPVKQRDFAHSLARALQRPCFFRTPGWVLRLFFGEKAQELFLSGAWVYPAVLLKGGFVFRFPNLDEALADIHSGSS